jgi:hypothetical protein
VSTHQVSNNKQRKSHIRQETTRRGKGNRCERQPIVGRYIQERRERRKWRREQFKIGRNIVTSVKDIISRGRGDRCEGQPIVPFDAREKREGREERREKRKWCREKREGTANCWTQERREKGENEMQGAIQEREEHTSYGHERKAKREG